MSRFFIDRPVFAWVLAIVVMLGGALSLLRMPVEQYPTVAPVTVSIQATYPGASAEALENTVTQVIEQQMTGIDRLRSINSTSDAAGNVSLRLTFESGTNPDIAQVQVQNKLQLATARLPAEVQQRGIRVTRSSDDFLLVAGFVSQDGTQSAGDIADWLTTNLQDPISRVTGVGDVNVFGPQRAMQIWLDPDRMTSLGITASDVRAAIRAQNAQVSAGRLGALPAVQGQQINATVVAQSRMRTPEQFGSILMRANPDGSQIRLRDIARVELGSETYEMVGRYNGKPAAGIAVKLATGANALTVADGVRERIASIPAPAGVEVVYPLDSTPFVKASIEGVVHTLLEAVVLVFLVMFLFLGNWRATLIPTIAVPVVLLGTFGLLSVLGFSVNTLTMFALVLAIGLLVDDAIVVVENVERVMAEEGLDARAATRKSMGQISGALVGIGLVLSAVFIPMAFFPGSAGVIYRQFSVTIVSSMMLSVLVALVLTPALCAALLKPHKSAAEGHKPGLLGRALGGFNRGFERGTNAYGRGVGGMVRRPVRVMAIYGLILVALAVSFVRLPSGFLPQEDKGQVFAIIQGPSGSTMDRTLATAERVERHFLDAEKDAVEGVFSVLGFGFVGQGQNVGMVFVKLRDYEHRDGADLTAAAIAGRAMGAFAGLRDAMAFAITPPAVPGMGNSSGFDMQLVDRGGRGPAALTEARNRLLGMAARNPQLMGVRPNGLEDAPQLRVTIDPERAASLGLNISEVNDTLSAAWGSSYVDDFIDGARVKRVYIQADATYRMLPDDIARWHVRSATGEMVPFSAFATTAW